MSDSQRLEVSTRVPARGQLHQLFRDQDARCGNVEEWHSRQLMSIAAHGPGCYVRADGTLVGAGLRDGAELLLAVAHCDGLDRTRVAGALLHSMRGTGECWAPTDDPALAAALVVDGWEASTVDLQMRRQLPATAPAPLPPGFQLVELSGSSEAMLHDEAHELACDAWGVGPHLEGFLDRFVRQPAYDAELWVLGRDGDGVCGAAIGHVKQLPDALVGKVASLAVAPWARGLGLAAALLDELCGRFSSRGLLLAQLGTHEDNPSGAPSMYRHLGWTRASSRTRWQRSV